MNISFILMLASVLMLNACNQTFDNPNELMEWLNNPENGYVNSKNVNGVEIKVKYLPPELLAYQEIERSDKVKDNGLLGIDTLIEKHEKSRTFMLTISPLDEENTDIMKRDVSDYQEYKGKFEALNFDIKEYITLELDSHEYVPVLSTLENTYGLTAHRNIILVFAPRNDNDQGLLASESDIRFVFYDEFFMTGTNHFVFQSKIFDPLEGLNFLKS